MKILLLYNNHGRFYVRNSFLFFILFITFDLIKGWSEIQFVLFLKINLKEMYFFNKYNIFNKYCLWKFLSVKKNFLLL